MIDCLGMAADESRVSTLDQRNFCLGFVLDRTCKWCVSDGI